jgi:hypothetical protein
MAAARREFFPIVDGGVQIRPLRDCEEWEKVVDLTYTMTFEVFSSRYQALPRGETRIFREWYRERIRPLVQDRLDLPPGYDTANS